MNCGDCKNTGKQICTVCCTYQGGVPDRWEPKPLTNADRIRAMTDEELAELISNTEANFPPIFPDGVSVKLCTTAWLDWLRQEAKDA